MAELRSRRVVVPTAVLSDTVEEHLQMILTQTENHHKIQIPRIGCHTSSLTETQQALKANQLLFSVTSALFPVVDPCPQRTPPTVSISALEDSALSEMEEEAGPALTEETGICRSTNLTGTDIEGLMEENRRLRMEGDA
ncbi:hypothetical protein HPB47_006645 [Ixodes persulcatus]|uniref:Uncharacterized protein n=1 Tax=Ixodes persulcatus TaxID=34615 RepID=A0AC60P9L8_IXOPE|nr:hypothetical protein HPB47_006645 [Ixodes persulcatus]